MYSLLTMQSSSFFNPVLFLLTILSFNIVYTKRSAPSKSLRRGRTTAMTPAVIGDADGPPPKPGHVGEGVLNGGWEACSKRSEEHCGQHAKCYEREKGAKNSDSYTQLEDTELWCYCDAGFTGSSCSVRDTDYVPKSFSDCKRLCEKRKGECDKDDSGQIKCVCNGRYSGVWCEDTAKKKDWLDFTLDECSQSCLPTKGECTKRIFNDLYYCKCLSAQKGGLWCDECAPGWKGKDCEDKDENFKPRTLEECQSFCNEARGDCLYDKSKKGYACSCRTGKKGAWCDENACERDKDCKHDGLCVDLQTSSNRLNITREGRACACTNKWSGDNCELKFSCTKRIRGRKKTLCQHGGKCRKVKRGRSGCVCKFYTTGRFCETILNPEEYQVDQENFKINVSCNNPATRCEHGTCIELGKAPSCKCDAGYRGILCEHPCPEHYYGKACSKSCIGRHFCRDNAPCDHEKGTCTVVKISSDEKTQRSIYLGCELGWKGESCNKKSKSSVRVIMEMEATTFPSTLLRKNSKAYAAETKSFSRWVGQVMLKKHLSRYADFLRQAQARLNRLRKSFGKIFKKSQKDDKDVDLSNDTVLSNLTDEAIGELNVMTGIGVTKIEFSKGSVRVNLDVEYPTQTAEEIDIQDEVRVALKEEADTYTSTLGSEFKLNKDSISVSSPRPVGAEEGEGHSLKQIITLAGLSTLVVSVVLILGFLLRDKKGETPRERMKKAKAEKNVRSLSRSQGWRPYSGPVLQSKSVHAKTSEHRYKQRRQ